MKTRMLLALSMLLFAYSSYAQFVCGFDDIHRQKLKSDPAYRRNVEATEKSVQQFIAKNKSSLNARTNGTHSVVYTIPVVVHVMHTGGAIGTIYNPSDAEIQNTINYLNQVFNGTYPGTEGVGDIQMQFVLATKDPNCNTTSAINRVNASSLGDYAANGIRTATNTPGVDEESLKNISRWNPFQYYNVWVVNKIDGKDGTSGSFVAGYAYFPGAKPSLDGTVMLATQMRAGQKTLPHEIGHAFGLFHTFEGSGDVNACPANMDCTVEGDRVCDTDPISYNQLGGAINFSCRSGNNTCTATPYSSNTEKNYMNYTNCYTLFTQGQKERMLAFAASFYRKSLATSLASSATYPIPSYSMPKAASCTPVTGASGLSGHYAGILSVGVDNVSVGSSTARNDNGYVNGTVSCLNLIQLVKGNSYTFSANVLSNNVEQLRAWIDYNNDGIFDNITEQVLFTTNIPKDTYNATINFTVPTNSVLNTMLRMRVIDEVSTIYGALPITSGCFDPQYGQAEDYPVYITTGTLPVTLLSFEGELKNNAAQLTWTTASSQGVRNFEVEKSTDGMHFEKIATIDAVNSASTQSYTHRDVQLAENNYYRLRIKDANGANHLSQVVAIRNGSTKQAVWVVNNPFRSYLDIRFVKPATAVKLQFISIHGTVAAEKIVSSAAGQLRWNLPGNLAQGTYMLKAVVGNEVFVNKVVKQ